MAEQRTMVERAAIAAFDKMQAYHRTGLTWDTIDPASRAEWLICQHAAIEAMREPTEAMLAAGWNIEMNSPVGEDPTLPNWQAMIDAALKE